MDSPSHMKCAICQAHYDLCQIDKCAQCGKVMCFYCGEERTDGCRRPRTCSIECQHAVEVKDAVQEPDAFVIHEDLPEAAKITMSVGELLSATGGTLVGWTPRGKK